MSAEAKIGLTVIAVGVAILAIRTVDQAIRNHRARQARAALVAASAWLDAQVEAALVEGVQDDPIYQRLCFERWESELSGGAS